MQLERSYKAAVRSSSCRAVAFSYNLDQVSERTPNTSQSALGWELGWTSGTTHLRNPLRIEKVNYDIVDKIKKNTLIIIIISLSLLLYSILLYFRYENKIKKLQ